MDPKPPAIARELHETNLVWASALIAYSLALFLGCGWAASVVAGTALPLWARVVLGLPLLVLAAHGAHMLGFVGHEGIHLMLHPNKRVSVLLGSFLAAMSTFSAVGYGISHWNHHRYTNQASDPDARIFSPFRTLWSRILLARPAASRSYLRNTVMAALGRPLPFGYKLPFSPAEQRALAAANVAFLVFWPVAYLTLYSTHALVFAIVLPLVIAYPMSGLRVYVEHAGTGVGAFRDSRSFSSRLYTLLFVGNNLHLEHHLYPTVPCYNLPEVHRTLGARGYFEACAARVEPGILAPLVHTTAYSQYPTPGAADLPHDPFVHA